MALVFSSDSKMLVSSTADQKIRVWNISNGLLISKFDPGFVANDLQFHLATQLSITNRLTNPARFAEYDLNTHRFRNIKLDTTKLYYIFDVSRDGKSIIASEPINDVAPVSLFDIDSGQRLELISGSPTFERDYKFSHDGQMVISTGNLPGLDFKQTSFINALTLSSKRVAVFGTDDYSMVTNVRFSPSGKLIAALSEEGVVVIWSIPQGVLFF